MGWSRTASESVAVDRRTVSLAGVIEGDAQKKACALNLASD